MTILRVCGVPAPAALGRGTPRRMWLRFVLVPLLVPNLAGCSDGPGCNGPAVRQALNQALDNIYADARKLAKVGVTVDDIVVVDQTAKQASCKALLHIAVDYLGLQKQERDVTIEYIAETTEQGRTLVTITTPP